MTLTIMKHKGGKHIGYSFKAFVLKRLKRFWALFGRRCGCVGCDRDRPKAKPAPQFSARPANFCLGSHAGGGACVASASAAAPASGPRSNRLVKGTQRPSLAPRRRNGAAAKGEGEG